MGSHFRSQEMSFVQILLPKESAFSVLMRLGEEGLVQLVDLNEDISECHRTYASELKRCDDMQNKLRFIEKQIRRYEIEKSDDIEIAANANIQPSVLNKMEAKLGQTFDRLKEANDAFDQLLEDLEKLIELKHSLDQTLPILKRVRAKQQAVQLRSGASLTDTGNNKQPLLCGCEDTCNDMKVNFLTGVLGKKKSHALERVLWRLTRGNLWLTSEEVDIEPLEEYFTKVEKRTGFTVVLQGDAMRTLSRKLCEAFHVRMYECPEEEEECARMLSEVNQRMRDLSEVLQQTHELRLTMLEHAAVDVRAWSVQVRKIKLTFGALNMLLIDVTEKYFVGEGWCCTDRVERIGQILRTDSGTTSCPVPSIIKVLKTDDHPPTHFRPNKFMDAFQGLVDAYGIAAYREINPMPFTLITFPFLFSLMFGDLGHAFVMLAAAIYLILKERTLVNCQNEIFRLFFVGRYIILMSALFSIYSGLVYNDVFSKSVNIYGSSWKNTVGEIYDVANRHHKKGSKVGSIGKTDMFPPEAAYDSARPYPFGVDPIWDLALENRLNFLNPMKMKLAVLIGICHMTFGVALSYFNHRYFHHRVDVYFVFIPRIVFLVSIFGYLSFQIVVKWIAYDAKAHHVVFGYYYPSSTCAPSIIGSFIQMIMFKFEGRQEGFVNMTDPLHPVLRRCHLNFWYPSQRSVEILLITVAIVAVLVMLLAKPFFVHRHHRHDSNILKGKCPDRQRHGRRYNRFKIVHHDEEDHSYANLMMNEAIHTIEFTLGCVSQTASYLRLWALSLAHDELSEIVWDKLLTTAMGQASDSVSSLITSAMVLYLCFALFAVLTVMILVVMEGISAFLHALRLHWVEFQSKFYGGTGKPFMPFSFTASLD